MTPETMRSTLMLARDIKALHTRVEEHHKTWEELYYNATSAPALAQNTEFKMLMFHHAQLKDEILGLTQRALPIMEELEHTGTGRLHSSIRVTLDSLYAKAHEFGTNVDMSLSPLIDTMKRRGLL